MTNLNQLKENIEHEKKIIKELYILLDKKRVAEQGNPNDPQIKLVEDGINSLVNQVKIANNVIPSLLEDVSAAQKLPSQNSDNPKPQNRNLVRVSYQMPGQPQAMITINKSDRERLLQELNVNYNSLKKINLPKKTKKSDLQEFKKPSSYARISNKMFLGLSNKLVNSGNFNELRDNLRKANVPFLITTYLSIAIFTTVLAFFGGVGYFIFSLFFSLSLEFPFIGPASTEITHVLINASVIFALPILVLILFYTYPMGERRGIEKKINSEIPFVAIHMSAIAGSGIEPSQIFRIIAMNEEYKYTGEELKKVINQVNVYGYDLINALKNTAKNTSSKKLSELLSGLATTIYSGGNLTRFLDKRAESLLFDYRLEREKYSKMAETFMDIYISIIIAAPMIMMMLIILVSITGFNVGMSVPTLAIVIVMVIALINVLFLVFLQIKQPNY